MGKTEYDVEHHSLLWKTEIAEAQKHAFAWRMLEHNHIEGLLPFEYYYVDNQLYFRYECNHLQPITYILKKRAGDFKTIFLLCKTMAAVFRTGQNYLLKESGYGLEPDIVFWNPQDMRTVLCYLPGREKGLEEGMTGLLEYLLEHLEHHDRDAVEFTYGLYEFVTSGHIDIEEISGFIDQYTESGEAEPPEEDETDKPITEIAENNNMALQLCGGKKWAYGKKAASYMHEIKEIPKGTGEILLGREEGCVLRLPYETISRRHAMFLWDGDRLFVMDACSENGSYVNGIKISAYDRMECREGDILTFADISFRLVKTNLYCQN